LIQLPLLNELAITDYGMYPGTEREPGLHVTFDAGLTLVLGVNGLGKTTLVTVLYRLCTGAFEISGLSSSPVLGSRNLEATRLSPQGRKVFATRVTDNAEAARATLRFTLGDAEITITRALKDLKVVELRVNGVEQQPTDDRFQEIVTELAGLPAFGDWILILRYLVFYFEDRRALVWDPSAQRQILRLLLLPEEASSAWAAKERQVLELDSRVRNLRNTLNREEGQQRRSKSKLEDGAAVAEKLAKREAILQSETASLEALGEELPAADQLRQEARLRALTFEQEYEAARAELERVQLEKIQHVFPSGDETARYLLSRILSEDTCQTCGTLVPDLALTLTARLAASHCIICDSDVSSRQKAKRRPSPDLKTLGQRVDRLAEAVSSAKTARDEAELTHTELVDSFTEFDIAASKTRAQIAALVRRLPPDERVLREQASEVSSLRGRLERLSRELDISRSEFENLVARDMRSIATYRDEIMSSFKDYARGFLFESSDLRWEPHRDRVGQTGPLVDFPAFEFEMAGSDFPSAVRRSGPEQVSESQREFVDLAFRMALMSVAGTNGSSSIVIDAPESSLDAVFSERAAEVLVKFSDPTSDNRVIVTSNLVDGQLIPQLLSEAGIKSPDDPRFVDLLAIATPTQAVRENSKAYEAVRDRIFRGRRRPK